MNRALGMAALMAALCGTGCEYFEKKPTGPEPSPSPTTAALEITVAPDPLKILWVCPVVDTNCYGSLDSTVTVTERAGIGGRLDMVEFTVRDAVLGVALTQFRLDAAEIQAKAGTNRIEPLGKLAVRPIIEGYPVRNNIPRPQINIDVVVQMTDDKGNSVSTTRRVPVT
ncbi:MAG TPA: hypothetical protein VMR21_06240 [Vicinamibacteria bacterium]|nr:hypothetical protein [Vicinamibacteria bacterium]